MTSTMKIHFLSLRSLLLLPLHCGHGSSSSYDKAHAAQSCPLTFRSRITISTLPTHRLTTLELQSIRRIFKADPSDHLELQTHPTNLQSQAKMCVTFRFYHLCGHIHKVTTFPCTYSPTTPLTLAPLPEDEVVASPSDPRSAYRPVTCLSDPADAVEEIRLFPTLCASCARTGIISEWLDHSPDGRRADVIRAWNKMHRHRSSSEMDMQNEAMPEIQVAAPKQEESDTVNDSGIGSSSTSAATTAAVDVDTDKDAVIPSPPPLASPSTTVVPEDCVPPWMTQSVEHRDRDRATSVDIPALRQRMAAVAARIRRLKQRHKIVKEEEEASETASE